MNLWMNVIYIFKEISRAINIRHATPSSIFELISVSWEVSPEARYRMTTGIIHNLSLPWFRIRSCKAISTSIFRASMRPWLMSLWSDHPPLNPMNRDHPLFTPMNLHHPPPTPMNLHLPLLTPWIFIIHPILPVTPMNLHHHSLNTTMNLHYPPLTPWIFIFLLSPQYISLSSSPYPMNLHHPCLCSTSTNNTSLLIGSDHRGV